jgi:hypothetical protein
LVYALIDYDSCYFIQIDNHNKWDDISLLSRLKRDFPKVLNKWKINGEPINKLTKTEREKLIKNCINTYIEIDGEFYMSPGMGMNTVGTSSLAVMQMNKNFNYYSTLQEKVKQLIEEDVDKIEKDLGIKMVDMNLVLQEIDPIIIHEPNNNIHISIVDDGKILRMEIKNLS